MKYLEIGPIAVEAYQPNIIDASAIGQPQSGLAYLRRNLHLRES